VSFASITLCVASQRVFVVVVYFVIVLVWKLLDTPSYIPTKASGYPACERAAVFVAGRWRK
jgi:hypothetical protein